MPKMLKLSEQEIAQNDGLNLLFVIDADDLTLATASTAQTITLFTCNAWDDVGKVVTYLKTPFQNSADTAFNTLGVTVGYTGTTNGYITTQETNANGSFVVEAKGPASAVTPFTTATAQVVVFTPTSGKNVKSINIGELHIFFRLNRVANLVAARSSEPVLTK